MTSFRTHTRSWSAPEFLFAVTLGIAPLTAACAQTAIEREETKICDGFVVAKVVALDQAFYLNRMGALQTGGMIFALESDVRSADPVKYPELTYGQVVLRPDKRARPIVLRVNKGDCLKIEFTNLLGEYPIQKALQPNFPVKEGDPYAPNEQLAKESNIVPAPSSSGPESWIQPPTRYAGVHVAGMQLVGDSSADGSWVGANGMFYTEEDTNISYPGNLSTYPVNSGLVPPGKSITYTLFAGEVGSYLLDSEAGITGVSLAFAGQLSQGLFGAVNVQPKGAEWYRSQVSQADLVAANTNQDYPIDPKAFPVIDYAAVYEPGTRYPSERSEPNRGPDIGGTPILRMYKDIGTIDGKPARELVHTDLTAMITGPNAGTFTPGEDGVVVYDNQEDPIPECYNCTYPERVQPYREVTVLYHDDFVAKQSFEVFGGGTNEPVFQALQGGRDFFAINYGMGAIGPPIWANRLGVGPMRKCATCKYEEFFLSSWPNGDPAMVVDFPANSTVADPLNPIGALDKAKCKAAAENGKSDPSACMQLGAKATKAFYPDDPSNVYHSYVGDHTVYRILHAGANITHVHHQHAHQWLHSPNSDNSHYRDSQMISPGAAYTLDYVYQGGGNKNQTPGDAIFHCHFYPHFAQGMWALWRIHDTFEAGTELDSYGRPLHGKKDNGDLVWNRALPDGEIAQGSPTPAIVPLPTIAMAPLPARVRIVEALSPASGNEPVGYMVEVHPEDLDMNPGYPFFVAGIAGQRATHPPMDFAPDGSGGELDGGLPRHITLSDELRTKNSYEKHNRWDFTKDNYEPVVMQLPEGGTPMEVAAMNANATRNHRTRTPDGTVANFLLNGMPPARGAPYAEPGITLEGSPVTKVRRYKAVDIELDVVFNKKGWHYPQQRITTLWGDVEDTLNGKRAAEPLFFRANSDEVVEYWLANLVPSYYDLDDFQVRTPTDVLGQHIHLVKFDVTSSDGAANGFNYEDGTLAAEEVRDMIDHINKADGIYKFQNLANSTGDSSQTLLTPKVIPYFGDGASLGQDWVGAQATVQRWYADPLLNSLGEDRTIRTVFTHDHFGPSTHQQAGLYAGLVVEPKGSKWFDPITGEKFGDRSARPPSGGEGPVQDGGPTSWAADIITADPADSYREFNLEFQDRQLTYKRTSLSKQKPYDDGTPNSPRRNPIYIATPPEEIPVGMRPWGWADPENAINPPRGNNTAPNPLLVTNRFSTGTLSLNYRNEPLLLRMFKPAGASLSTPEEESQASDLSYVFASIPRFDPPENCQPNNQMLINTSLFACIPEGTSSIPPPEAGFRYENPFPGAGPTDPITPLMRAYEGDKVQIRTLVGAHMAPHSFNLQGLRWKFEPADTNSGYRSTQGMGISEHYEMLFDLPRTGKEYPADYMYVSSSGTADLPYGNWGLLRAYNKDQIEKDQVPLQRLPNNLVSREAVAVCPDDAPVRQYYVTATTAQKALGGPLVYNARGRPDTPGKQRIVDWNALFYMHTSDLDAAGHLKRLSAEEYDSKKGASIEPLILRAAAGDCLKVTLQNHIPSKAEKPRLNIGQSQPILPAVTLETSRLVGLHAELVSENVTQSNGVIIGRNPTDRLAEPGKSVEYTWYAGIVNADGKHVPVEFGSAGLTPSDPLMQSPYGMIGALVIEPQGSCWTADPNSRASANVYKGKFVKGVCDRSEFLFREHVTIVQDNVARLARETEEPGVKAGTEALTSAFTRAINYGTEPIQYRFLNPNWQANTATLAPRGQMRSVSDTLVLGDPETPVFTSSKGMPVRIRLVHPSGLAEQTWTLQGHVWQEEPYVDGSEKIGDNPASQWFGARDAFGPNNQFDIVIAKAGGEAEVTGDYLYRSFITTDFFAGLWGIFRVGEKGVDVVTITGLENEDSGAGYSITGVNSVNPTTQKMAKKVTITGIGNAKVDQMTGAWSVKSETGTIAFPLTVTSPEGGVAVAPGVINAPAGVKMSTAPAAKDPSAMFTAEQKAAGVWPPKHVDGQQFGTIPWTQP